MHALPRGSQLPRPERPRCDRDHIWLPPPAPATARRFVAGLCWLIVLGQLVGLVLWSWQLLDVAN
ncbi:MAG TPA: hypothetical protein VMD59_15535 [Acidimicrobiales bacterium]|nr:hypothetical protein [Acidimicrobiales bacterium]